jgi:hypothetical protein
MSSRKRSWAGCGCPRGSKKVPQKGRGRGWACISLTKKRTRAGRMLAPFVKATCG